MPDLDDCDTWEEGKVELEQVQLLTNQLMRDDSHTPLMIGITRRRGHGNADARDATSSSSRRASTLLIATNFSKPRRTKLLKVRKPPLLELARTQSSTHPSKVNVSLPC